MLAGRHPYRTMSSGGEFIKEYKTTFFVSYGTVRKEFVLVPDKLLLNTKELEPYFDISFKYVASLKGNNIYGTKKYKNQSTLVIQTFANTAS
jgi:hypothetical protein